MLRSKLVLLSALCSLSFACGGRSALNDYEDGVASIVPRTSHEFPGQAGGGKGDGDADGDEPDAGEADGDKPDAGDGDGPGRGQALKPIGAACNADNECGTGSEYTCLEELPLLTFFAVEFPGGLCTSGCQDDDDCPEDSACLKLLNSAGCMPRCDSASDCRRNEGYACNAIPFNADTRTYCLPPFSLPF